jgi:type III secretion protein C
MTPMVSTHKEYHHMARKALHRLALGTILGAALLLHSPAMAGAPPVPAKVVTVTAVGAKADDVLRDLFAQAGLKVKVSSLVNAPMNGKWTVPANQLWRMMASTHNLVGYYEGGIVRIYSASEVLSRTIPTASPGDVVREASRLGLTDAHNRVTPGSSNVSVTGVPEFVRRIEDIAGRATAPQITVRSSPVPRIPSGPSVNTGDVISPAAKGPPVGTKAPVASVPPPFTPVNMDPFGVKGPVRSVVDTRQGVRSPYEMRIFYLKHRSAVDEESIIDGVKIYNPGVATLLEQQFGDGRRVMGKPQQSYATRERRRIGEDDDYDQPQQSPQQETVRDVNGPRISADPHNNSIMVRDRPEAMASYEASISAMDIEQPQIEVEATIIELNITRLKQFGIDIDVRTNGLQGLFGGESSGVRVGVSAGQASVGIKAKNFELAARLDALIRNGSLKVVSKPRVTAKNNKYSVFTDLETVTRPISSERTVDVDEQTAGLLFKIKPAVKYDSNNLRTELDIEIRDGSILGTSADGSVRRRASSIITQAVVAEGEALIVGGLTVSSEYEDRSKTAGLGDIPVLGAPFKRKRAGGQRLERLFMITPRIYAAATSPAAMAAANNQGPATNVIPLEVLQGKGQGRKSGGKR